MRTRQRRITRRDGLTHLSAFSRKKSAANMIPLLADKQQFKQRFNALVDGRSFVWTVDINVTFFFLLEVISRTEFNGFLLIRYCASWYVFPRQSSTLFQGHLLSPRVSSGFFFRVGYNIELLSTCGAESKQSHLRHGWFKEAWNFHKQVTDKTSSFPGPVEVSGCSVSRGAGWCLRAVDVQAGYGLRC